MPQLQSSATTTIPRLDWIDQVKGFTIFLVVYGHNFPFCEKFIYTFHMPLFIMVAGFFHPAHGGAKLVTKRMRGILLPYFCWALLLYAVWLAVGRNYGDSAQLNLSPLQNFIGVFYAQGDRAYMDWGIPMWFLPAIFLTFLLQFLVLKVQMLWTQWLVIGALVAFGCLYPYVSSQNLVWSFNIACVALLFYAIGYYVFPYFNAFSKKQLWLTLLLMGAAALLLANANEKIDMYRGLYGNPFLFALSGLAGSFAVLAFFKLLPVFRFLGFIGKFSLLILALQLLAMTFIKLVLMLLFKQTHFDFTEFERFGYAIIQVLLLVPVFLIVNKFAPWLNGGFKKI